MAPPARGYHRRQYLVHPGIQYRFLGVILFLLLLMTVGAIASVYASLWVTLKTFGLVGNPLAVAQLTMAGLLITLELLLLAPVVIWIGVRLTHKVAGPLVRISGTLRQMAQGDYNVHLTLRKGDSLTELAQDINILAAALRSHRS